MTILYLVRHGETDWNQEGRIQGHRDPPLNSTGRGQARALAKRLAGVAFAAAFASDLKRAWQTAEILLDGTSTPLTPRPGLRERYLGRWEAHLMDDIAATDPEAWRDWLSRPREHAPHGGETEVELERRALATLSDITTSHPDSTVLAVSHGGTIRAILNRWVGVETRHVAPNCGAYVIVADGEKRELRAVIGD